MRRDSEKPEEIMLRTSSCTECTGLVPAQMDSEDDAEVRSLYAVEPAEQPEGMHGKRSVAGSRPAGKGDTDA